MAQSLTTMLKSNYTTLRRAKEAREDRDLPIRIVANETKMSSATIQKVAKGKFTEVSFSTIVRLLRYFKAKDITDLVEYAPDSEDEVAR